jgi:predicted DNA-binding transcriptional regulator AlpA
VNPPSRRARLDPEPPAAAIESLIDIDGLARILGCNRRTVERLRSAGRLPPPTLLIGRRPRWAPSVIRRWIDEGGRRG